MNYSHFRLEDTKNVIIFLTSLDFFLQFLDVKSAAFQISSITWWNYSFFSNKILKRFRTFACNSQVFGNFVVFLRIFRLVFSELTRYIQIKTFHHCFFSTICISEIFLFKLISQLERIPKETFFFILDETKIDSDLKCPRKKC